MKKCSSVAKWVTLVALVSLLVSPVASGAAAPATETPASWTFMVYMAADNNLEGAGVDDFIEAATAGSDANVNIVIQFDRIPGYDTRYGDWTSTKRYLVGQGMVPDPASAISDIGEANMGAPQTVIDFVTWAEAEFPAQNYALVFWNHGSGWEEGKREGAGPEDVCWDDTNGDALTTPELAYALDAVTNGGANPVHLVGFDACLMGMIEVDTEIRPYCDVTVSSQETEPWDGWPYELIMADLTAHPTWTAAELGYAIVDRYYQSYGNDETQSAKDVGAAYDTLLAAVDTFAQELIAKVAIYQAQYQQARNGAQSFGGSYVDLYHFAQRIHQYVPDAGIRAAAQAVMDAVTAAVINEKHGPSWPNAHGISIEHSLYGIPGGYGALQFAQLTHWDEYLDVYFNGPPPCVPVEVEGVVYTVAGLAASFDSTVSGDAPVVYEWDFGDGSGGSSDPDPVHTFPAYGNYLVTLTATNCASAASDTWQKMVYILPGCSQPAQIQAVDWTADDLTVSFDSTVLGQAPLNYAWAFGDGGTSVQPDPTHTYPAYGLYDVTLDVSNCGGGATDSWSGQVQVSQYLFFDDMELGTDQWTASGLWHLADDSPCPAPDDGYTSPTHAWYYGQDVGCNYDTGATNSGNLITADAIVLDAELDSAALTFWSWEETECDGGCSYDHRTVAVSTNGGGTWTEIWGSTGPEQEWYQVTLDLSAYLEQSVLLRFRFDSVDSILNDYVGWLVDDVAVEGVGGSPPPRLFVGNIKTKYRVVNPGPPPIYKVQGRVPILDEALNPVVGAVVTAQWELPGGQVKVKTATTRPNGSAFFTHASPQAGTYVITVLDVQMPGYIYDPGLNWETSEELVVP